MRHRAACWLAAGALVALGACAGRGRDVFVREGCGNCHRFRELGSGGAIDLSDVGSRRNAKWIETQIGNPAANDPSNRMPPFRHIRGFDLQSLIAFLRS